MIAVTPRAQLRKGTPTIWPLASEVEQVCIALEKTYHSPRHGNPPAPLDDLIFILLSNRTTRVIASSVFVEMKSRFTSWEEIQNTRRDELLLVLRPAGLSRKRADHLVSLIDAVVSRFGRASLDDLHNWPNDAVENFLTSLPGVSTKVAKCVMLYTLDRDVLPVDVHVHRLSTRLGWHWHKRADQSHETLERIVMPELRYGFHVNAIAHGRSICSSARPACDRCPIRSFCKAGIETANGTSTDGGYA